MRTHIIPLAFLCISVLCCISCKNSDSAGESGSDTAASDIAEFAVDTSDLSDVDYNFSEQVVFEDSPVRNTTVSENRDEETSKPPASHKPYKHGKAYRSGFAKGYEQGKHDAEFCERYRYGLLNRSNCVGTEANEYEQGYRDGYDEAYNCGFQVSSNPQNPEWR